jgi:hypothetical protein
MCKAEPSCLPGEVVNMLYLIQNTKVEVEVFFRRVALRWNLISVAEYKFPSAL